MMRASATSHLHHHSTTTTTTTMAPFLFLSLFLFLLLLSTIPSSAQPAPAPADYYYDGGGVRLTIVPTNNQNNPFSYSTMAETSTPARKGRHAGYLVQATVGSSPVSNPNNSQNMSLMVDTGSDFTWARCGGPRQTTCSSSPRVPCSSPVCDEVSDRTRTTRRSCDETDVCEIELVYQDGERVWVDVTEDSLVVGGVRLPSFTFGAADDAPMWARDRSGENVHDDGILGLGRGGYGFPNLARSKFGGVFSYCLPASSSDNTGFLYLGGRGLFRGRHGCMPLNTDEDNEDDYMVDIESLDVGNFTGLRASHPMLIDSGTVVTLLERRLYAVVRQEVRAFVGDQLTPAPERPGDQLDTCYLYPSHGGRPIPHSMFLPNVVFHFAGGVSYKIDGLFVRYDPSRFCLAFRPTDYPYSILGNVHQHHRVFTFDIVNDVVCISQENRRFC